MISGFFHVVQVAVEVHSDNPSQLSASGNSSSSSSLLLEVVRLGQRHLQASSASSHSSRTQPLALSLQQVCLGSLHRAAPCLGRPYQLLPRLEPPLQLLYLASKLASRRLGGG